MSGRHFTIACLCFWLGSNGSGAGALCSSPAPAWDDSVPLRETQESGAKSCSRMPAVRMALPPPPGIPKHPGGLVPPPLPLFSRHPPAHLWKLTSVGLCFYTSSEPPPSFQRASPSLFWAAQLHQRPIQLSTIPVLLFTHCSHHRDGELHFPSFHRAWARKARANGIVCPLSLSLTTHPSTSSSTHSPLWLHPTTSSFANCRLCVTRPLHTLLLLPGTHLLWLHCLKTSSDITSFEKPL